MSESREPWMAKQEKHLADFHCWCGSKEYKKLYPFGVVLGPNGPGREFFYCLGCTTLFLDPEKYSLKWKDLLDFTEEV